MLKMMGKKNLQFYAKNFCLSKPMFLIAKYASTIMNSFPHVTCDIASYLHCKNNVASWVKGVYLPRVRTGLKTT